ncbi:MAG: glycosyltransferase family 1 protein [Phycisphaerae bacterium]|nr:glycosyltransferase family 1 protein [Phycisphaerae bacterium]
MSFQKTWMLHSSLPAHSPHADRFDLLAELALDMRWSWSHYADKIWEQLDPVLWKITQNPWAVLQACSGEKLEDYLSNAAFREELDNVIRDKRESEQKPGWFRQKHPDSLLTCAAYFCMEFMLSEALPIYSGGLGNVAGDQLKAASDLGVPVVGIGLFYQRGYYRQIIDQEGLPQSIYPYNDPAQIPVTPVRKQNGQWLRIEVRLPGYSVWLRTWQVNVGKVKLYLLDTNDVGNYPAHRGITGELYGGGSELRLQQELVLAIGGWRLLQALGIRPEVCHLNEGHAGFVVLERARSLMEETGVSFELALAVTRMGNLFTTHTPVPAGFDCFAPELIQTYLGTYANNRLGISVDRLLSLGRKDPHDSSEPFNMAYLAIRGCGAVNAVSRLHGKVSRNLFQPLFPRWPQDEVPIGHITNGVHMPSWDSLFADDLWTHACGKDRWLGTVQTHCEQIRAIPDSTLWQFRYANRNGLIEFVRERLSLQLAASGASSEIVEHAKHILDPNLLTVGFARRFASYKRPNLLLRNPDRLKRLLTNPDRPMQLIIAGKAHPADSAGQSMIREWTRFVRQPQVRARAVFLSDYDMQLAERLVQGVDVWINNPRVPYEASGTSGMKVLVNGGLNVSVLDGWWAEAFHPGVGWAIGDGAVQGDDSQRDASDAEDLYRLLENEVIPAFYDRRDSDLPVAWLKRVRDSMAELTHRFSATRTVIEYTEQHYLPAAAAYRQRESNRCEIGGQILAWQKSLEENWPNVHFNEIKYRVHDNNLVFEVMVDLKEIDPESIQVELYADRIGNFEQVRKPMQRDRKQKNPSGIYLYRVTVPANRPPTDFTPRIIPFHTNGAIPLEASYIVWQK